MVTPRDLCDPMSSPLPPISIGEQSPIEDVIILDTDPDTAGEYIEVTDESDEIGGFAHSVAVLAETDDSTGRLRNEVQYSSDGDDALHRKPAKSRITWEAKEGPSEVIHPQSLLCGRCSLRTWTACYCSATAAVSTPT